MSRSFVIHAHSGHGPLHYDLMIEEGASLATWQLPCPPHVLAPGASMEARRIQDHRRAYLDYEGAVSNQRGRVTRIDRGDCQIAEHSDTCWEARMIGQRTRGLYNLTLKNAATGVWSVTCVDQD